MIWRSVVGRRVGDVLGEAVSALGAGIEGDVPDVIKNLPVTVSSVL